MDEKEKGVVGLRSRDAGNIQASRCTSTLFIAYEELKARSCSQNPNATPLQYENAMSYFARVVGV